MLQMPERRLLRLVEAALSVSEYTDKVDVLSWNSKTGRIHAQIKDICAILCGLVVAQDYKKGQKLMQVGCLVLGPAVHWLHSLSALQPSPTAACAQAAPGCCKLCKAASAILHQQLCL